MQDPMSGKLTAIDDTTKVPDGWPVYKVGEKVKFRGWWWEIVAIDDGQLTVAPRTKASRLGSGSKRRARRR